MRTIKGPSSDPISMYIEQDEILPIESAHQKIYFLEKGELTNLVLVAWAEPGFNNFFPRAVKSFL